MTKPTVSRFRCRMCGSALIGEMGEDGRIYETLHPERVVGDTEEEVLCIDCYEATHPKEVPGAAE